MSAKSYIFSLKVAYEFDYFKMAAWHSSRSRGPPRYQADTEAVVQAKFRLLPFYKTHKLVTGSHIMREKVTVNFPARSYIILFSL